MIAGILFISFIMLLLLNVPIALSLGLSSIICLLVGDFPMDLLPMQIYSNIGKFTLLAIPFFILAGNVMEKAGISEKLIHLADSYVGHKRGGLAIVCVICACFFAAISGSGPATVAALGVIIIPAMQKNGYGKSMPSALMATSGAIGIIIPPSIAYVVYGAISGESIGKLFIAGVIPGIVMGIFLIIASQLSCKKLDLVSKPKSTSAEKTAAFKDAIWGLMMPVIILGGIYGGLFTPTESAAVAAMYGLLVGIFVYRKIKLKDFYKLLVDSAVGSATIMMIIACASLFAWFCQTQGISAMATELILSISSNEIVFLIIVNVLLLIAGCFIDASSAMYIFVPIMLPVAKALGYDAIQLGIVMTMNLAIGQVTPPVGVNLYVACNVGKINLKEISKAVLPFVGASLIALMLVTYIPQLSLFLPGLMGK